MQFRRMLSASAGAFLAASLAAGAQANEFKWSYQGEARTLDPYGLSEIYTLGFQGNTYEPLVRRNRELGVEPALATSWRRADDVTWVFTLRPNVKFHNGNAFDADDVLFSHQRALSEGSDAKAKVRSIEGIRKIDAHTVEIKTKGPSPTLLSELSDWYMMDKEWCVANAAEAPADVRQGKENFATRNANGTGPFMVQSRQPDVRTVFKANPHWWDKKQHNLETAIFTPIKADATRVAALLSGEVDMVYPVPLQDVPRLNSAPGTKVLQAPELRIIFFGFDMHRDELLYSNVKGKNPFKDRRVREAFYAAIDVDAIASRIMQGAAKPTGALVAPGVEGYEPALEKRGSSDVNLARKLLADAGYANGFEITLDCPNDRYVKDEDICTAAAGMLARVGVKARVAAITRTRYFGKILARDTSMFMLGWVPPTYDAHNVLFDLLGTPDEKTGQGKWNMGNYSNPKVDALQKQIATTVDQDKRRAMIREAFALVREDIPVVPLHQQTLSWGVKRNIDVVQRADEILELRFVQFR